MQLVGALAARGDAPERRLAEVPDVVDPPEARPRYGALRRLAEEVDAGRAVPDERRERQVGRPVQQQVAEVEVEAVRLRVDLADEAGAGGEERRERGRRVGGQLRVGVQEEDPLAADVVAEEEAEGGAVVDVRRGRVDAQPRDLRREAGEEVEGPVGGGVVPDVDLAEDPGVEPVADRLEEVQEVAPRRVGDDGDVELQRRRISTTRNG